MAREATAGRVNPPSILADLGIEFQYYELQHGSFVYALLQQGRVVYIGATTRLAARIGKHLADKEKHFDQVFFAKVPDAKLFDVERELIRKLLPDFNRESPQYVCRERKTVTTAEAAELTGIPARTLETLRLRGGGPSFIVTGMGSGRSETRGARRRGVRYRISALREWLDACERKSTSDDGRAA